jgi:hypothetical protein
MVIHDDILYKCTTACSAASWAVNSACFTATTLASVVTQLNEDLNQIIKTGNSSKSVTVSAGNETSVEIPTPSISGYKCIGIVSVYCGNLDVKSFEYFDNYCYVKVRNPYSSGSITQNVSIKLFYVKSKLII